MENKKLIESEGSNTTTISNNIITNKVWDETAVLAVNDVAKALLNLTELFRSGDVNVTGISLNHQKPDKEDETK